MEFTLGAAALLVGMGVAAGVAAGFVGIGGGIVMVPLLLEVFRSFGLGDAVVVQSAMGTSLTVATFSVASSAYRHHRQRNVVWHLVPWIAPTSMLGARLAAWAAGHLEGTWLQVGLALVLLWGALRMLRDPERPDRPMRSASWYVWALVGFGVGLFAGFSGLAGGNVLVPALVFFAHVPTRKLAGTSSAVVMFTSAAGAAGYMLGDPPLALPDAFVGYVHLPAAACLGLTAIPAAQFGAWLNRRVGSRVYKRVFGVILLLVVVRLLLTA
ncbi:MAG: sulfite exporter TauE/SafE family protein [Candidatus Krumholzibacteriia bacterium]